jgi:hypothetical protein
MGRKNNNTPEIKYNKKEIKNNIYVYKKTGCV